MRTWPTVILVTVALFSATSSFGRQWTDWRWLSPQPQGWKLLGGCEGNGLVVVVGTRGTILIDDGNGWEVTASGADYDLFDVTWTGERFVAVGGAQGEEFSALFGVILSSEDGRFWEQRFWAEGSKWTAVHWNGTTVIAIGQAQPFRSVDGVTWSPGSITPLSAELHSVAWDGTVYIAAGVEWGTGPSAVFQSLDGSTWTQIAIDGISGNTLAIAFGNGQFIVLGRGANSVTAFRSIDGEVWSAEATDYSGIPFRFGFFKDRFIISDVNPLVGLSDDGLAWEMHETGLSRPVWGLAPLSDQIFALGDDGQLAASSSGELWTEVSVRAVDAGSATIRALTENEGVLLGVGGGAVFRRSPTGIWSTIEVSGASLEGARWIDGRFWITGRDFIASSTEGESWEIREAGNSLVYFYDIASNDDVLVAVGWRREGPGFSTVAISGDSGFSWVQHEIPEVHQRMTSVTVMDSTFFAVSSEEYTLRSPNGFDWNVTAIPENIGLRRIVASDDLIVAVGFVPGTGDGAIATSTGDGQWDVSEIPNNPLWDVIWTGKLFVATGLNGIETSKDGANWEHDPIGFGYSAYCGAIENSKLTISGRRGYLIEGIHVSAKPRIGGPRQTPERHFLSDITEPE